MALVRWNPLQELDSMERRMRRLFDDVGIGVLPLPPADAYETEREYVFEIEVPGFDEEQLTVEVTDHTLVVRGERAEEKEEKDKTFHLHERLAREFERRFELPAGAASDTMTAEFKDGVLTIRAPKTEAAAPHKVAIAGR